MAERKLRYKPYFQKRYKALPREIQKHVNAAIKEIEKDEISSGRDPKRRHPKKRKVWQIRVVGQYRLTYRNDEGFVELLAVGTHDEIALRDC